MKTYERVAEASSIIAIACGVCVVITGMAIGNDKCVATGLIMIIIALSLLTLIN